MRQKVLIAGGAALLVLIGLFVWFKNKNTTSPGDPPLATTEVSANPQTPGEQPQTEAAQATPVVNETPPLPAPETMEEADVYLVHEFENADLLKALLNKDLLVDKAVTAAEAAWRDENPLRKLEDLHTPGELIVTTTGNKTFLADKNYERYLPFMSFLDSLNEARVARIYTDLHPLLQQAYQQMGNEHVTWDELVDQVLNKVSEMTVPASPPELKLSGKYYVFVDPALEALPDSHKVLIRMGPALSKRLQDKIKLFHDLIQPEQGE